MRIQMHHKLRKVARILEKNARNLEKTARNDVYYNVE